jgi:hypothetical protein
MHGIFKFDEDRDGSRNVGFFIHLTRLIAGEGFIEYYCVTTPHGQPFQVRLSQSTSSHPNKDLF